MNCPHCNHPLSIEEARSIRGALNRTERKNPQNGKPASRNCGTCPKCLKREQMRRYRAKKR